MEDNKCAQVYVDVHVRVSVPGMASVVEHYQGMPRPLTPGQIYITTPGQGACVPVLAGSPSGTGSICAKGTLSQSAPTVWAQVYSGSAPVIPSSPPGGCASCSVVLAGTDYTWGFDSLPGAACGATCSGSQAAPNVLAVWTQFGTAPYTLQTQSFNGLCSTHTGCDGSGAASAFAAAGYPVLTASAEGSGHPPLTGTVLKKTGRFAALPEYVSFEWQNCAQGWVWQPEQAHCGTFTLQPCKDWFLLHSTVASPPLISAQAGGTVKPLHLVFEVTVAGDSRRPERLVLEVSAAGGPSSRRRG